MWLLATLPPMRRHLTALLVLGLVLGACGGDDDDDRAAVTSIPEETTTSTTTTTEPRTVAPDVIPTDESQITEEYVEDVLNELFSVAGAALAATMEAGLVEETAIALIEATSSASTTDDDLNELIDLASTGFEGIKPEPSALRAEVLEILLREPDCVVAEIELDRSGIVEGGSVDEPDARTFARLVPASEEQRASGKNPTAWVTDGLPTTMDGSVPQGLCDQ